MNSSEFVDVFCGDEGLGGAEVALSDVTTAPDELTELTYNVWILHVDRLKGVVRFEHDFLPDEGSVPLSDFIAGLQARLTAG